MILFRYLAKQVVATMLAVTLVLLLIFMSGRFIKYLGQAASGGISPDVLFQIMAYRLPGFLELILPLGFFIGILLAYGRMYLESEMTVLHACGFSRNRLLLHTLLMSALVTLAVGAMSLFVSPWGMQKVELLFQEQAKVTEFELLSPGRFQKFKSGSRVTYTEALSDDKKTMFEVFISESPDDQGQLSLIYAQSGTQTVNTESGERFLLLENGTRYKGIPGGGEFEQVAFERYGILIDVPDAEQKALKEEAIPTSELLLSDRVEDRALLQWRVSLPMLVPVVTLLAVALCRVNPRQGRFFHLLPSMLLYVLYLGLLIVARKKISKGELDPLIGVWAVHMFFAALALLVFFKDEITLSLMGRKKGNSCAAH